MCLAKLGKAYISREVRLTMKEQPNDLEAQVAMLAIQLGMIVSIRSESYLIIKCYHNIQYHVEYVQQFYKNCSQKPKSCTKNVGDMTYF